MDVINEPLYDVFVVRVGQFNLFILPLFVAAVLVRASWGVQVADAQRDRERSVRWAGLINYVLAVCSLLKSVPDVVDFARFGTFPTFPVTSVFWPWIAAMA